MEESRKIRDFIQNTEITVIDQQNETSKIALRDIPEKFHGLQLVHIVSNVDDSGTFSIKEFEKRQKELEEEMSSPQMDNQRKFDIYRSALEEAWDDSVMTIDERAILEGLRIKLGISEKEHRKIEDEVLALIELPSTNKEIYRVALLQAYADGRLSDDELQMLDKLRMALNISEIEHNKLEQDIVKRIDRKENKS